MRGILVSMVVRPEAPPLTVEHYKNLPETGPRYQLIEGDLHMAPAPNRYHQDISRNLEFILLNFLKDHPIGVLYDAPFDVYLSETDVFQPDIVVVLNPNRGLLTDAGCEGAPDFVVEILSPKTRRLDLENKKRVYDRHGVQELWIIDPEPREVLVYRFGSGAGEPAERFQQSDTVTSPLLPGLVVALEEVFSQ
jgi:Uma2 family endonuclease